MNTNTYAITKAHTFSNEILVCFLVDKNFFITDPKKVLVQLTEIYDYSYIIVCNDEQVVSTLKNDYQLEVLFLEYDNKFQALKKVFKYALKNNFKFVVEFETDYQYDILEIKNLFSNIIYGFDVVIGNRLGNTSFKNFHKNKMMASALKFKKIKIADPYCFFRIFNWNYMQIISLSDKLFPDIASYSKLAKKYDLKIIDTPVSIRKNHISYSNEKYQNDIKFYWSNYFKIIF